MKRYLIATLVFALLLPVGASAQWYLFPGSRPAKDSTSVVGRVFVPIGTEESEEVDPFEETSIIKVSLILPFKTNATPNSNFLDFYCGVLMAADGLCSAENKYEISVFDSAVGLPSATEIADCDLIIGPVSYDDMRTLIPRARGKFLVSPLDPKVAALSNDFNVIQAPAGWEAQVDDLVRWISEDLRGGDAVVLLQSADEKGGEITARLAARLGEAGIAYDITSTPSAMEGAVQGTCRFVIASENDAFCSNAVREVALMNLRGGHNIVYSTSKLRSLGDLEVESMHAAATRITASYYADPKDRSVRLFNERYKMLFKGEPGQWVYQGYDLMNYFGAALKRGENNWQETLAAHPGNGLQADFKFEANGKVNNAVRRLKYNSDNTITVVK